MEQTRKIFAAGFMLVLVSLVYKVPCHAVERIHPQQLALLPKKAVLLDARPRKIWKKGHLPGALSFSWEEYTETDARKIPYRTLPPEKMAFVLGEMGITENTPVVIVGDAKTSWGGEGWIAWVLAWVGHKGPVHILEGGTLIWQKKGVLTKRKKPHTPVRYAPNLHPAVFISAKTLHQKKENYTLVDTRSLPEWVAGRIKGAVHIPWKKMIDPKTRTPIATQAMKDLLQKKGVRLDKPVVYYCTGGVRSAWAWMAHEMAGLAQAINLEGGYEEWKRVTP